MMTIPSSLHVQPQKGRGRPLASVDALVARLEVSRLAIIPLSLTFLSAFALNIVVQLLSTLGKAAAAAIVMAIIGWMVLVALDVVRCLWTRRHPYASQRWLRGVSEAVGEEVMLEVFACLIRRYRHDPDYVINRAEMINVVHVERAKRREARRRAEGFRLVQ